MQYQTIPHPARYEAAHDAAIPYREVEEVEAGPHQAYQHTFPKYTEYTQPPEYTTTEYSLPSTGYRR